MPVVRAHPPFQPDRHGGAPALLRGGDLLAVAWPQGRRAGYHPGVAWRDQATPADDGGDRSLGRGAAPGTVNLPDRYRGRARLLQARGYPALCVEAAGGRLVAPALTLK